MTKEEVDAEKRKLLYHWIGLLSSLTKLQNAGELDVESTLAQLTEPMMIERVNALLSENLICWKLINIFYFIVYWGGICIWKDDLYRLEPQK